jgi:hypothetical protein
MYLGAIALQLQLDGFQLPELGGLCRAYGGSRRTESVSAIAFTLELPDVEFIVAHRISHPLEFL